METVYFNDETLIVDTDIFDTIRTMIDFNNHGKKESKEIKDEQFFRELQYCVENSYNLRVSFEEYNIFNIYSSKMLYPDDYREIYMREKSREDFEDLDYLVRISSMPDGINYGNTRVLELISEFLFPYCDCFVVAGKGALNAIDDINYKFYDIYFYKDKIKEVLDFASSKTDLYYDDGKYFFIFEKFHIRIFPWLYSSPSEIAHSFSVDCECIIYIPNKFEIYCTERCYFSLKYKVNFLKFDHYSDNIVDYIDFDAILPDNVRINDLFENTPSIKTEGIHSLFRKMATKIDELELKIYPQYPYHVQFELQEKPQKQSIEDPYKWVNPYQIVTFDLEREFSPELKKYSIEEFKELIKYEDENVIYDNLFEEFSEKKNLFMGDFINHIIQKNDCFATGYTALQGLMNYNIGLIDMDFSCKRKIQSFREMYLNYCNDVLDINCEIVHDFNDHDSNYSEDSDKDEKIKDFFEEKRLNIENTFKILMENQNDKNLRNYYDDLIQEYGNFRKIYKIERKIPYLSSFGPEKLILTKDYVLCDDIGLFKIKHRIGNCNGFKKLENCHNEIVYNNIICQHSCCEKIKLYHSFQTEKINIQQVEKFVSFLNAQTFGEYRILKFLIQNKFINMKKKHIYCNFKFSKLTDGQKDDINIILHKFNKLKTKQVVYNRQIHFEALIEIPQKLSTEDLLKNMIEESRKDTKMKTLVPKKEIQKNEYKSKCCLLDEDVSDEKPKRRYYETDEDEFFEDDENEEKPKKELRPFERKRWVYDDRSAEVKEEIHIWEKKSMTYFEDEDEYKIENEEDYGFNEEEYNNEKSVLFVKNGYNSQGKSKKMVSFLNMRKKQKKNLKKNIIFTKTGKNKKLFNSDSDSDSI